MKAKVINSTPEEINLSIKETDIGILYIVQHEVLKKDDTNFAGVIMKHPLTSECWMRVSTSTDPLDELKRATDSAIQTARDLKELINSTVK